jgi:hypothetical protein
MSTEFGFTLVDANARIEEQQGLVRKLVQARIGIDRYSHGRPD